MHQSADEYDLKELIGKGSFGNVWKGFHLPTKKVVAVKVLSLDVAEQELVDVQQEIALLSQLKAAEAMNVTKYYGSFLKGPHLWIIMDYCSGGSVRTLMKPGRIEEKYITVLIRETLSALAFIHKFGIIHRDVKAANILVSDDGRVQLCDFGVSALVQNPQTKRSTFVGTPWWMAPEVIMENQTYNFKADIWSLGITILEIANGHPPYHDQEPMRALLMIPRQPPSRLEGGNWSQALRDFVSYCLCELPEDRMTADELSRQKLIKNSKSTPVTILRELVLRLKQWQQSGGQRVSLLNGPTGLDDFNEADGDNDDAWNFDDKVAELRASQIRARNSATSFLSLDDHETIKAAAAPPAIKPLPVHTGADHPLVKLFAADNTPSGYVMPASNVLQPPFQPAPPQQIGMGRSPASTRPASPEPLMTIDLPSFDDENGEIIAPSDFSSSSTFTQIELPSEEDFMTMRQATPLSAANVIPSVPAAPVLGATSALDRPDKLSSNRAQRIGPPAIHMASKSADIPRDTNFSVSPGQKPQSSSPEDSKRSSEATTVSAPSSPPRQGKFSHAMPASKISNPSVVNGTSGHKSHHLPSRSAPHVALREASTADVPPIPSISEVNKNQNRSADSTPLSAKNKPLSPDSVPSTPPVPTVITSGLSSQSSSVSGSTSSTQTNTPRATGFNLRIKLPANPHLGVEVSTGNQLQPSPGRFLSPLSTNPGLLGSQASTPTAATHFSSFNSTLTAIQQQPTGTSLDPWGMPMNVILQQNALFPSATNEEVSSELDRLLGLLDVSLGVFSGGIKQYQAQLKGQPAPIVPLAVKRARKPRKNMDPKASDTEGFVSESN